MQERVIDALAEDEVKACLEGDSEIESVEGTLSSEQSSMKTSNLKVINNVTIVRDMTM